MKYCTHCGAQLIDEAVVCVNCGCSAQTPEQAKAQAPKDDTMSVVIKVFLVIGCVASGWALIPLAWCIPITVSIFKKLDSGEPISTGLKVAALLLVNLIAGICLLCSD